MTTPGGLQSGGVPVSVSPASASGEAELFTPGTLAANEVSPGTALSSPALGAETVRAVGAESTRPATGSAAWLTASLPALIYTAVTRNTAEAATSAAVTWPDGTTGTYTATVLSASFPGGVDAYTVTYGTTTVTQPQVTRDSTGAVTAQPAVVVTTAASTVTRAAFFYPWYPESWYPTSHWTPVLGAPYTSSTPSVIAYQLAAMQYCGIQAVISSWWGQSDPTNTIVPQLLAALTGRPLKFTLYYEPGPGQPGGGTAGTPWGVVSNAASMQADLTYIWANYAQNPAWLWSGGKPVLFVYGRSVTSQADVTNWYNANLAAGTAAGVTGGLFTLSLQVIPTYLTVTSQPALWHQYGPAVQTQDIPGQSYSISPGYWKYDDPAPAPYVSGSISDPYLPRTPAAFAAAVQSMIASGEPWQLVTSWNEWGEGHSVENAVQWQSASGFGVYCDILASNGTVLT